MNAVSFTSEIYPQPFFKIVIYQNKCTICNQEKQSRLLIARPIIFSLRNYHTETGSGPQSKSLKAYSFRRIQSKPWRPLSRTALGLLGELVTGAPEWVLGLSFQVCGLLLPLSSPVFPLVNVGYNTWYIGLIQMANKHKVLTVIPGTKSLLWCLLRCYYKLHTKDSLQYRK